MHHAWIMIDNVSSACVQWIRDDVPRKENCAWNEEALKAVALDKEKTTDTITSPTLIADIRYATWLNSSKVKLTNDHKARKKTYPEATYQKPNSRLNQQLKNHKNDDR